VNSSVVSTLTRFAVKSRQICGERVPALRWRLALAMGLAIMLAFPMLGTAAGKSTRQRLDRALRDKVARADAGTVDVIVRTVPGKHAKKIADFTRRGHQKRGEFRRIGGMALRVKMSQLQALADDPDVLGVSIDAPIRSTVDLASETALRSTLGLYDAGYKWSTGAGIGVAVIDSGIAVSEDLPLDRIVAFRDFTGGNGAVTTAPVDGYGHGTHVASLIAGSGAGSNSAQYQGIAPNVSLIGLRVLNSEGTGSTSNVIAAVEWAVANRVQFNIRVINMSLGHPIF